MSLSAERLFARVLTVLIAVGLVALGAAKLLEGGGDRGGGVAQSHGVPDYRLIAHAAERTANEVGSRMTFTGTAELPQAGLTMQMSGSGVLNAKTLRTSMRMRATVPGLPPGPVNPMELSAVSDGDTFYMSSPAFAGGIPDGKTWMMIRMPAGTATAQSGDPRGQLDLLRALSKQVVVVGNEQIRGASTTHYRATVDHQAYVNLLRDEGYDQAADQAQKIYDAMPTPLQPVDVWVDQRGYVRRVEMTMPFDLVAGPGAEMRMRMEMFDFGIEPKVPLPPGEEVYDATDVAQEGLDRLTQ